MDEGILKHEEVMRAKHGDSIKQFISTQANAGRHVMLITSGGTTVPLERRSVRFVDNFSMGTRGSATAEYVLEHNDFAVVFLTRVNSLQPFMRHLPGDSLLDVLTEHDDGTLTASTSLLPLVQQYNSAKMRLLRVPFTTIHEYLALLYIVCEYLRPLGKRALIYLAAAVSDFYIPLNELPEHKIQSEDGPLTLRMALVPKMLRPIVMQTAPEAFVVSFKLETDENLLENKARASLVKYGHQLVIGNILTTRKTLVYFYERGTDQITVIRKPPDREIEVRIVEALLERYARHVATG